MCVCVYVYVYIYMLSVYVYYIYTCMYQNLKFIPFFFNQYFNSFNLLIFCLIHTVSTKKKQHWYVLFIFHIWFNEALCAQVDLKKKLSKTFSLTFLPTLGVSNQWKPSLKRLALKKRSKEKGKGSLSRGIEVNLHAKCFNIFQFLSHSGNY